MAGPALSSSVTSPPILLRLRPWPAPLARPMAQLTGPRACLSINRMSPSLPGRPSDCTCPHAALRAPGNVPPSSGSSGIARRGQRRSFAVGYRTRERGRSRFLVPTRRGALVGESLEEAVRREIYEETGARLGDLGPVVWVRHVCFPFDGRQFEQHESIFVVRTERFEVGRRHSRNWNCGSRPALAGGRWQSWRLRAKRLPPSLGLADC